jgi:hypothetical protein
MEPEPEGPGRELIIVGTARPSVTASGYFNKKGARVIR